MKISEAFERCGSDKTTDHSYGDFYDDITQQYQIRSVLEIGVFQGGGLAAWKLFNSGISVIGVDTEKLTAFPTIIATTPDYAPVVDYCEAHSLKFDIIIDDGGHQEVSQILGLYYLRQFLNPSGLYVIEDIQNDDIANRMQQMDGFVIDLRNIKQRYDDVLAVWHNH